MTLRKLQPDANRSATVRKPGSLELAKNATVDDAIATIFEACFNHWTANEAAVIRGRDPEGVHQMRVALRRTRSAISDFKGIIPAIQLVWLKRETGWLVTALGSARDWDVFLSELLAPVLTVRRSDNSLHLLQAAAERAKRQGYEQARDALRSSRYSALVTRMRSWLAGRRWRLPRAGAHDFLAAPARELAAGVLAKRHRSVLKRGGDLAELSPRERHKLRIALKKLRYTAEFFGSFFPGKRRESFLKALGKTQDSLGHLNDVVVAEHLLQNLSDRRINRRDHLSIGIGIVIGWHQHSGSHSQHEAVQNWRSLCRCEVYW
jgi:triphosphatase